MAVAQLTLTEAEIRAIEALSESQGKTQEEILHEAVEHFLARHETGRLAALRQARGIWQEREDLPDPAKLRNEWNRV